MHWVSRGLPAGVRHGAFAARLAKLARGFDVIYTMSVLGRSAAGARAARTPYVVKLPDDPAYERARRLAGFRGSLEEFQSAPGLRLKALRSARLQRCVGRRASSVPSEYLRELALGWGLAPGRIVVLPNPAPEVPPLPAPEELRRTLELNGQLLVFAGRMNAQKSLEVALEAVARTEARSSCSARARIARGSRNGPRPSGWTPESGFSVRSPESASWSSSGPPTPRCCPRAGRTSRTRWWSPSPSGRR